MPFRVTGREPLWVARLKLLYLVPIALVLWLPIVIYEGVKEVGNPLRGTLMLFLGKDPRRQRRIGE